MPEIKITFSDGSTALFHEEQTFHTWVKTPESVSLSESYSLSSHPHDGLVPSFLEILINSELFFDIENPKILYTSNSVVKIEVI